MLGKMIAQGLAATAIVAVLAFGYAASAQVIPKVANYAETAP